MKRKFAFIGAGSLDFTRDLVRDIMTFPAFADCEFALMDIDSTRLKHAEEGVRRIVEASGNPATVTATLDRRQALKDADGVLITILQGGVDVWRYDVEIPMKYGVDLCVGDTRGPGGVFRFLRTAPVMLSIIRDIEEVCPKAIILNYTNPMAMLVSYMQSQTELNVTGLCHSVQGTAAMLAEWIGKKPEEIEYTCAGINHQAFFLDFKSGGKDMYPEIWKAIERPEVAGEEMVRIELLRHLKYFPTESSGHNSEYYPWFRKRADLLEAFCTHGTGWNPGIHAAILDEYLEREDTWESEFLTWLHDEEVDLQRGEEYASNIFNAIFGDHTAYQFNANLRNKGYITNVVENACVEVPVVASQYGIIPKGPITLPPHLSVLVDHSARIEELAVRAAVEKNVDYVYQAVLFDPLTTSVCSMEESRQMVKEMLAKNRPFLEYLKF